LKYTTFNRKLWNLKEFDTIGYDKNYQKLIVKFFNGEQREYQNINERTVFLFTISSRKDEFFQKYISKHYTARVVNDHFRINN
jgi:hypothetical protein